MVNSDKVANSKFTYRLFLWGLVWVILLYDLIQYYLHFSYIDELFTLLLGVFILIRPKNRLYMKEFLMCICVFLFFLVYSLFFGVNVHEAVWMDFLLQLKPYIAFYAVCLMDLQMSDYHKKKLHKLCKKLGWLMIPFGFLTQYGILTTDAGGPRFTSMVSIIGLLYLYSSNMTKKDLLWTFAIWTVAFIPMKSKFFGFYALALALFYGLGNKRITLNPKYLCFGVIAAAFVFYAAYEKFSFYFIGGSQSDIMFARPALFFGAWEIIKDYFPFGSGFGSFGSFASAEYFSRLYWTMDVARFSELSEGNFLCDTFFPSLAQCGAAGLTLFIWFWWRRVRDFNYCYSPDDVYRYKCLFLMFGYFMIESTSDTSYVQNRGLYMFMLMALFMNEMRARKTMAQAPNSQKNIVSQNTDNVQ